jgi:hypothetical protein
MTGLTVAAGIYSTSTCQFIEYDSDELLHEWHQLKDFTQRRFTQSIETATSAAKQSKSQAARLPQQP